MAKFLSIPVTGGDNYIVKADAIVTALRLSSTKTSLIIQGGSGTVTAGFNLSLTHAADTATGSVAKALMDAVVATASRKVEPETLFVVALPKAVSAIAIA